MTEQRPGMIKYLGFWVPLLRPKGDNLARMAADYLLLRRFLGVLGIVLPFLLIAEWVFVEECLRTSISAFYYSGQRDLFVGIMCAIGIFLICYRGHNLIEDTIANFAGIGAVGVGLLPTTARMPADGATGHEICLGKHVETEKMDFLLFQASIGDLHFMSAALFFLMLSILCGVFFIISPDTAQIQGKITIGHKRMRNWIYTVMTLIMLGSIALIALDGKYDDPLGFDFDNISFVFWLEAFAVWAFAIAWLVKGEFFTWLARKEIVGPGGG